MASRACKHKDSLKIEKKQSFSSGRERPYAGSRVLRVNAKVLAAQIMSRNKHETRGRRMDKWENQANL